MELFSFFKKEKPSLRNISDVKTQVTELLKSEPETRDNDNLLISRIIEEQEGSNICNMSARDLLRNLMHNEYGSMESIRRSRQLLQEKTPTLRGNKYLQRQAMADNVRKQIA